MHDISDQEVAQTFRKLSHEEDVRPGNSWGIYASWVAILLLFLSFFFVSYFILDADRRAETVRLKQSTELMAQTLEARVMNTSELLQKTSMRLIHLPQAFAPVASSELSAIAFMQERREVLELTLVSKTKKVLRTWASPSTAGHITRIPESAIIDSNLDETITRAFAHDSSTLSLPYSVATDNNIYADLVVPTPTGDQVLVARLDFSRLMSEAQSSLQLKQYTFRLEDGMRPFVEDFAEENIGRSLSYATTLSFFASNVTLSARSYEHNLFFTSNLQLWWILGLAGMLALSLALLLRYQQRQHGAQRRLMAEYSLRRSMMDSYLAGVRVTDREGKILFINSTFEKMFGFTADELIGIKPPYPYWAQDITKSLEDVMAQDVHSIDQSGARPHTFEFQARRKNGTMFTGELNISPLFAESGRHIGWIAACYDITEQQHAREEMHAAHERFTRVVQSMNSAIAVINPQASPDKQLLFCNSPYEKIFGNTADGASRLTFLLSKQLPATRREGIFDTTTGRWFDARTQSIVWMDDLPALMMIAMDITERKEVELALEAQLRKAEVSQRLVTMGEMASSLAHELNQPLAAIANYASGAGMMLAAGKLSTEDTLGALNKVVKQAQRAAAIIKRIRGFAKRSDPQFLNISCETVVSETMELALIQASKLNATIVQKIAPNLPLIYGDAVMLEQLLLNLLKNAMEAVQPCENHEVTLIIAPTKEHTMVQFDIMDHGPGIAPSVKEKLFEPFFSTKNEGMGMGLNICRSIVEIHHGRITILDTPGGGTTFRFTIPVAKDCPDC